MKKIYRVTKFYHYAEMYDIEAETGKEAIAILESETERDPDDKFEEFDFYETEEITKWIQWKHKKSLIGLQK